jgi:hypothetical protein
MTIEVHISISTRTLSEIDPIKLESVPVTHPHADLVLLEFSPAIVCDRPKVDSSSEHRIVDNTFVT